MKAKIRDLGVVKDKYHFELITEGFNGYFFITFENKVAGFSQELEPIAVSASYENASYSAVYRVEDVTDAMLYVERKKQWILEELRRMAK